MVDGMKVFNTSFTLTSDAPTEVADITKRVREALQQSAVTTGIALVTTMRTTCALMDDLLTLGRFQSIIFAEFDGPRSRELTVQVLGE